MLWCSCFHSDLKELQFSTKKKKDGSERQRDEKANVGYYYVDFPRTGVLTTEPMKRLALRESCQHFILINQ